MRFSITAVVATLLAGAAIVAGAAMPEVEARATDSDLAFKFTTTTADVIDAPAGLTAEAASQGRYSNTESQSNAVAATQKPFYGCTSRNFKGTCKYITMTKYGACYNMPSSMNNVLSSLQELYTNVGCYVYTGSGCSGTHYGYITYGRFNLVSHLDNNLSSFRCYILS